MNDLIQWKKGAQYWDKAWNPIVGCQKVSEGCQNCYAERLCQKFGMNGESGFVPTLKPAKNPPKSGVVFAGNMTDLFGEWVRDADLISWIDCLSHDAINLVLTKRSNRLEKILSRNPFYMPFHVLFGITAENQERYNERIHATRNVSLHKRCWLSAEPLLGPIDMQLQYIAPEDRPFDWCVVGAESGPDSVRRPCKLEWVESLVHQCRSAGILVFVKQLEMGGRLVKDIEKFPSHLQIRQVPWEVKK